MRTYLLCFALSLCLWLKVGADTEGLDPAKLKLLPRYCGLAVADRLVKGPHVRLFEYPWMAVLQYDHNGEIDHGCSGSLINNRYVLTAAHCLANRTDFQLLNVRLGEFDKSEFVDCETHSGWDGAEKVCAEPADDYGVESITIHPDYNEKSFRNDIGLVRLNRDVTMHDNTSPVCLPITSSLRSPALPRYFATGWGTCRDQTGSNMLQIAEMTLLDGAECDRALSHDEPLNENQTCASSFAGIDAGGPLGAVMSQSHGGPKFVQLGVATGAMDSCAREGRPGVYTRVANYMEWILDTIDP